MTDDTPVWLKKWKQWGTIIGLIGVLGGALVSVWKTVAYINTLHDTIGSNKQALTEMRGQIDDDFDQLTDRLSVLAQAVREQRDRDHETITDLRIAVAALQAMQSRQPVAIRRETEERATAALSRARVRSDRQEQEDPLAALEGL